MSTTTQHPVQHQPQHTWSGIVRWPDEAARRYREQGYWKDRPLGAYLMATVDRVPDRVALVDGPTRFSYAELADRVDAAALRLLDLGLRSDDRILVQMPNTWQFVVLTLACLRAGIIPLMALPAHREAELVHFAHHAECVAIAVPDVVKDHDFQAMAVELAAESPSIRYVLVSGTASPGNVDLDALLAPGPAPADARRALDAAAPDPDSPACFLLSGGTTGLPKLITRTHNDYAYNVEVTSANTDVSQQTVYLVTLPAGHNFPLGCPGILGTLFAGGRVVMLRSSEPTKAFEAIEAEGVTLTSAVPAIAHRWVEHARATGAAKLASLEVIQVGGSRLADEIAYSIAPVLGAKLQQTFGMAEGLVNATRLDDPDDVVCTTQGRPVSPGDEIRVVDEDGRDVIEGTPGSFLARGPYTPRGYYRAPEHNSRSFTAEGWYRSGDIVVRRSDGNLVVLGRDKDMINRGGEKISAEEVEGLVYRLASVTLAAAVSMPDPVLGERVCVYATVRAGESVTLADVQRSVREAGVAAFKVPEHLVVVEEMPLTRIGKIDKAWLRSDITARLAASTSA